jgi:PAS domain S-box-containing protein
MAVIQNVFGGDKFFMCVFELLEDDLVYVLPNNLMADYVRMSREDLTGRKASELAMPAGEIRKWVAVFEECREKNITVSDEFFAVYNGRDAWYESNVSYIEGSTNLFFYVAVDITERKKAEEMLHASEEKFRMVAESANTGILLVQGEDIVYINQALAEMCGYTVDECKNLKFWNMVPPDRMEYIRWAGNARQQGWMGPSRTELKLIHKNGGDIWLDCNWSVPTLGGKPSVLVMCVDITARKRAESDVLKSKAQAELYLDLMGHDINNLNQIAQGFLEMAIDSLDLAPKQKELLEKPLEALQGSSRIIASIRKLQKAERGEFPSKTVDVCNLLEELKARYSNVPDRKVTINFEYTHPACVPANELIGDIFSNIIGNAIKHSDPGKPLIINLEIENVVWDDKGYFRITIEDNGPGISDEMKAKLFSRFTRGETRSSGKGLGLYIARTLVQSFQGKLWVEDRVHGDNTGGTRFVVLLPVAEN